MSERLHIVTIDLYPYTVTETPYIRFEMRVDLRHSDDIDTCLDVNLPWTGRLQELIEEIDKEVKKQIASRLDVPILSITTSGG